MNNPKLDHQARSTSTLIRSSGQFERQQELRALYRESNKLVPTSREGNVTVDAKENVDRNYGPKSSHPVRSHPGDGLNSPVLPKDKRWDAARIKASTAEGAAMTGETQGAPRHNNCAVTPSPKPDKNVSPASPKPEDATARAAQRRAWPLRGVTEPGENDCLFGRGGGTNHHPGNKRYRQLVESHKATYLASKRLDKPLVAMRIIAEWRNLDPPGRFLKQDDVTKLWNDVGDKKAREKTSQALREKTPVKARGGDGVPRGEHRAARFVAGTGGGGRELQRVNLARDHSLGETFTNNEISLEGFSWDGEERPVVRNESADIEPRDRDSPGEGGGGRQQRPRGREEPPPYGGEQLPHDLYGPSPSREEYPQGPSPAHRYPYAGEPGLVNNAPSESAYHPWEHSSYYGHHYSRAGLLPLPPPPAHHHGQHPPPPSPGHGHHPSPYHHLSHPTYPSYSSPQNHHHATYAHHLSSSQQRSREHSLQMNPLKGASTSQPAPDTFTDEQSPGHHHHPPPPPPLPSPTYETHPSMYYGYTPSPHQGGWPTPPGSRGAPSSAPRPQFLNRKGSNPSAFARYDAGSRADSLQSLGSSVDAYYDRRDSGVAAAPLPDPVVTVAGTSRDFSKIAELIRDSSERTRSNSLDESTRAKKGDYDEVIPRSKSMPQEGGGAKPSNSSGQGEEEVLAKSAAAHCRPSLLRKLSGGSIPARRSPVIASPPCGENNGGLCHPKPIKRDTSNQPETMETKRSVKRVVLSRDQSAVSRRLKQEQEKGQKSGEITSKLKRAELLDRKLSVEINKLGLEDSKGNERPSLYRLTTKNILGRMTTEDVLGHQPLDRMTTEDVLGAFIDDEDQPPLGSPSTPALNSNRITTIDAIALEISNEISKGNGTSAAEVDNWGNTLDFVNDPTIPSAPVVHDGEMSGGVNADIAEKWLKGET